MLRIKLVKIGKKDRPTWKVVVVEKSKTGKGLVSDFIGSYNPHLKPKEFKLDVEKYTAWVKKGAQATDTVKRLKGKFIDKTKDYQKEVGVKIYKRKKPVEQENKKPIKQENKEDQPTVAQPEVGKEEEPAVEEAKAEEAPIEEAKEEEKAE